MSLLLDGVLAPEDWVNDTYLLPFFSSEVFPGGGGRCVWRKTNIPGPDFGNPMGRIRTYYVEFGIDSVQGEFLNVRKILGTVGTPLLLSTVKDQPPCTLPFDEMTDTDLSFSEPQLFFNEGCIDGGLFILGEPAAC